MTNPQNDETKTPETDAVPNTIPNMEAAETDEAIKDPEVTYNDRKEFMLGDFISKIETEGIEVAIAIIIDPKIQNQPIMHAHGATYNLAKASCQIAKYFKAQLDQELSI